MLRKLLLITISSFFIQTHISASFCDCLPELEESSISISGGYRHDNLKWNTKCNDLDTKVNFKNINIWEIGLVGKYVTCNNIYFRGYANYGWLTSGHSVEKDLEIDEEFDGSTVNVTDNFVEYSQSKNKLKGHVYDASLALGYQFTFCNCTASLSPILGYSWHGQNYNGKKIPSSPCNVNNCENGGLFEPDLNDELGFNTFSTDSRNLYHTRWNGPWLGLDFEYLIGCDWTVFLSYEYHWAHFHAKSRLAFDIENKHSANNARGQIVFLGTSWDFCNCWTVGLVGQFRWWHASNGKERTVLEDFDEGCDNYRVINKIKLKSVSLKTTAVYLNLGYVF